MKLTDAATSWSFECLTDASGKPPAGGLVLQQVTHDGHNFAKDIRVIGFWIETEVVDPAGKVLSTAKKFYVLDAATFTVSSVRTLVPKPVYNPTYRKTFDYLKESDAALDFAEYFKDSGGNAVAFGVSATFDAPALFSAFPNCEYAGMSLEQIFLFSRYASSPKHEPSGGVSAGRCHPMIRYELAKNAGHDPKKQLTRVRSIRFDYRLYLFLDRHYNVATNATLTQLGNQAGLFADRDSSVGVGFVSVGSGMWNIFSKNTAATAVTAGLFEAAEKPVVLEVIAPGLGKGFPKFRTTPASGGAAVDIRCWDNVHWWGSRGPGSPIISTPGAFHCAHLHWRWGAASKLAGVGSDPHFNPTTYPAGMPANPAVSGMWGPLVDPGIWIQSLRIAVTKNDPRLDPSAGVKASALSRDDWRSLFDPGLRASPDDISAGDDIVLWYSAEVHRDLSDPTIPATASQPIPAVPSLGSPVTAAKGTIFIHGIFFPHDAEKTGMKVGSTDPVHKPTDEATIRSAKQWFRSGN